MQAEPVEWPWFPSAVQGWDLIVWKTISIGLDLYGAFFVRKNTCTVIGVLSRFARERTFYVYTKGKLFISWLLHCTEPQRRRCSEKVALLHSRISVVTDFWFHPKFKNLRRLRKWVPNSISKTITAFICPRTEKSDTPCWKGRRCMTFSKPKTEGQDASM